MASTKTKPAPNTYSAHRGRQRDRILDAAEKLFIEHGIDRVTMAELTARSGVQASTLYQYFSSKDDIVWAIVGKIMAKVSARTSAPDTTSKSGLDRIVAFLEYMAEELANQQPQVRFMAQFDAMYARHWPVERLLALEAETSNMGNDVFRRLIQEGIDDGSLRPDLDPALTMQALINAAIGTQRRLASLGSKVELEYGRSVDQLFRETIRLLVLGLRGPGSPQTTNRSKQKKVKHDEHDSQERP